MLIFNVLKYSTNRNLKKIKPYKFKSLKRFNYIEAWRYCVYRKTVAASSLMFTFWHLTWQKKKYMKSKTGKL